MGLTRSLSIGASSLRAHQMKFDTISNNLANLNTVGFKSNRADFVDQFNQVLNHGRSPESRTGIGTGGTNPIQFGLGVKLGAITQDMSQGALEATNRSLDIAIQGEGFFIYDVNGLQMYSRAGNIARDRFGFLVDNATGAILQGFPVQIDSNGQLVKDGNGVNTLQGTMGNLNISSSTISQALATSWVKMAGNLNADNVNGAEKVTTMTIYDDKGTGHELKMKFSFVQGDPLAVPPTTDSYSLDATLDGVALTLNRNDGTPADPTTVPPTPAVPATPITNIEFASDGTLKPILAGPPASYDLGFEVDTSTTAGQDLAAMFSNTPVIQLADPDQVTIGITNYAGSNSVTFTEQDGYQKGDLIDLSVDAKGKIWGAFTNGKSELLGQVALAKFTNNEGLVRNGNNFFTESPSSGSAITGTAIDIFPSTQIAGNALEQSNVDMTTQFTDMISTQRAYEAAARTITLSDQLLAETTNLKR